MTKKRFEKRSKNWTWVIAYAVKIFFANFATFLKKICDFSLRPCGSTDSLLYIVPYVKQNYVYQIFSSLYVWHWEPGREEFNSPNE